MALKSIEKHLANHSFFSNPWLADMIADVEAEVAERFMELPVDMDGVPIHLGDLLLTRDGDIHSCLGVGEPSLDVMDERCEWWRSDALRHTNPRTLTDVLCDLFEHKMTVTDAEHELCELLGGDAR